MKKCVLLLSSVFLLLTQGVYAATCEIPLLDYASAIGVKGQQVLIGDTIFGVFSRDAVVTLESKYRGGMLLYLWGRVESPSGSSTVKNAYVSAGTREFLETSISLSMFGLAPSYQIKALWFTTDGQTAGKCEVQKVRTEQLPKFDVHTGTTAFGEVEVHQSSEQTVATVDWSIQAGAVSVEGKGFTRTSAATVGSTTCGEYKNGEAVKAAFGPTSPGASTATLTIGKTQYTLTGTGYANVVFTMNGHGTQVPTQKITTANTAATEPTAPTAEGWQFGGWFTDAECTQSYNFSTIVTESITLYAKWTQGKAEVAVADGITYPTLMEAVNATKSGNVTLLQSVPNEDILITKPINLNGGNHTVRSLTVGYTETTSGKLTLVNNNLTVDKDLVIKAGFEKSGSITLGEDTTIWAPVNLTVTGDVYMDKVLDPSGTAVTKLWYAVAVPFEVKLSDLMKIGGTTDSLQWKENYLIKEYNESARATSKKAIGWVEVNYNGGNGKLLPGKPYVIASRYGSNNEFCFKRDKSSTTPLFNTITSVDLSYTAGPKAEDNGWNGVGNTQLHWTDMTGSSENLGYGQTYHNGSDYYDTFPLDTYSFAVGVPVFVQATATGQYVSISDATHSSLRSVKQPKTVYNLRFGAEGSSEYDQIFLTGDEQAATAYAPGKDVAKMGNLSPAGAVRMWMSALDNDLCVHDAKLTNGEAIIPLQLYVPSAGRYTLYLNTENFEGDGSTLRLLYGGKSVHEFNSGDAYTIEATKAGTLTGYSLQLTQGYTPVPVDEVVEDDFRAYIREGVLYVEQLPEGAMVTVGDEVKVIAQGEAVGGRFILPLTNMGLHWVQIGSKTVKLMNSNK